MNGEALRSIGEQGDCVQVYRSLKMAAQIDKVVNKAYRVLAFIS